MLGKPTAAAAGLLMSFAGPLAAATTNYFVQPIIFYGAGVINGLDVNGATSSTQSFFNAPVGTEAQANLADGTLKGFAGTQGGSAATFVQPRFGETVTVQGGLGSNATFSLALDGSVVSDPKDENLNSTLQVSVDAYFAVYDGDTDVDELNWGCFLATCSGGSSGITPPSAGPLGTDRFTVNFDNHLNPVDEAFDELLSVVLPVTENNQTFKVFANLTLISNRNSNPGSTTIDFLNTATFGISGVDFTSASGVFLSEIDGSPSVIPLPAAGWMLLAGVGAMGFAARRRDRENR
ncbi:MAG: VPLPA-CTERM sorting domain-containing protein [Pseudomonadota bacterium]